MPSILRLSDDKKQLLGTESLLKKGWQPHPQDLLLSHYGGKIKDHFLPWRRLGNGYLGGCLMTLSSGLCT